MTIAKDFASKLAVAFVAIAMSFMAIAPAFAADESSEDLQKTINDLLAQVAALQADLGSTTPAPSECGVFTTDLTMGSTGAQVMSLQKFLNADPDTRVAASGAGSLGMETDYFGGLTAAAVSKFQVKYRAEILTPAGLVNPTGYWGPSSRAHANTICVGSTPDTDGDEDEDGDSDEDMELSGEGSLDTFEVDDAADSDVEEGQEDAEIAELTLEATDGDIQITRMDIALEGPEDSWDVLDELSLWVDGEKVADVDASDEDEYLDEDDMTIRFSDLDIVLMEDEEVEILIGASIAGSVDDLNGGTAGLGQTWSVEVNEIRYFDADGVATDDDSTGDIDEFGGTAVEADFEILEEGEGEELTFSLGDNNPDSTDIVVDEDDTTDGVTILEYTIEAEENDIELNELSVAIETGTASVGQVVDDVMLVIDGDEFDAEGGAVTTGTSTTFVFDIDGDIVIDEDEEVTVEVVVDFNEQDGNYAVSGETVRARVSSALADDTDAEGADDLDDSQISGSAVGDLHTLVSEGIVVPVDGVTTETDATGDNNQTGEFSIEFEVTAVEGDFYIAENAGASVTTGVQFLVETAAGTSTASGVLASSADEDMDGVFTVRDGETETFTLTVTVDTNTTTQARVTLTEVNWSADEDGDGAEDAYVPTPASDFRTGYQNINAN